MGKTSKKLFLTYHRQDWMKKQREKPLITTYLLHDGLMSIEKISNDGVSDECRLQLKLLLSTVNNLQIIHYEIIDYNPKNNNLHF